MTVISLSAARDARKPHWEGPCKCIGCGHEWHGVAPIGTMWVDCPSCELPKGHPKHPFGAQEGDLIFTCNCGSEALTAYQRKGRFYLRCMACGDEHTEAVFG
jgi:hypothetical protein